tara:strand:+ start:9002 stop:9565 length:564 start_codon:yes stop_codon:yes gene_type:complete
MRKKFIEVYDDLVPKFIQDSIETTLLVNSEVPLYYVDNVATAVEGRNYSPGFSNNFYNVADAKLTGFSPLFLEVLYRLGNAVNVSIDYIYQGRVFVQVPPQIPSPDDIHVDLDEPHYVCLYYINDTDGDTIIFDDDRKEIQRITPKKGRIVFFDGSLEHCSSKPSKTTRAVINVDFWGTKFGEEEKF